MGAKYALNEKSEFLAAWYRRMDKTAKLDFDTFTVGINTKFGY